MSALISGTHLKTRGLQINAWVEEQTREEDHRSSSTRQCQRDTRLVLVNAVYFKGLWAEPFDKKLTQNAPFYCADGETLKPR